MKASGIMESPERIAWLERLLRNTESGRVVNDTIAEVAGEVSASTDNGSASQVRGAEEACRGLRTFSCAKLVAQVTSSNIQEIYVSHRNSLEACNQQTEDEAMHVDLPSPRYQDTSHSVKTALKVVAISSGQCKTPPRACRSK